MGAVNPLGAHADDPLCWPHRADSELRGLPPHMLSVNELDPLRDEGLAYQRRLVANGVSAVGRTVSGTVHGGICTSERRCPTSMPPPSVTSTVSPANPGGDRECQQPLEGEVSTVTVDLEVPVLIVGGGGAGLTASMLLSHLGVESLLVSRYPETSRYPKAHVLNQRSMEIFTDVGVARNPGAQCTDGKPAGSWMVFGPIRRRSR